MNREQIIENLGLLYDEPWNDIKQYFELLADLIKDNFEPKQQMERVTAKEVYLKLIQGWASNPNARRTDFLEMVRGAHEASEAFSNYKPESNEKL